MSRPCIALVGGGVYAARLAELIATDPVLGDSELHLSARRWPRLQAIAEHIRLRLKAQGSRATVEPYPDFESCVRGADAVVLMIRIGGLAARAHDESFPLKHGLAGDEGLSAGGFANGWRTLPALGEMAQTLHRAAPQAKILNLVAPLGLTTRRLLDADLETWGLCELPVVTRNRILGAARRQGHQVALDYCGLNHLGFFWPTDGDTGETFEAARSAGLVEARQVHRLGAIPLPYFTKIFDPSSPPRAPQETETPSRADHLRGLAESIFARMTETPGEYLPELEERPTPWFEDAVLPALRACFGGPPEKGFANFANGRALPFLPSTAVIELAGHWGLGKFEPNLPEKPSAAVVSFLRKVEQAEELAYEAALYRRPELLRQALQALPLEISEKDLDGLVSEIRRPTAEPSGPSRDPAPGGEPCS